MLCVSPALPALGLAEPTKNALRFRAARERQALERRSKEQLAAAIAEAVAFAQATSQQAVAVGGAASDRRL